MAFSYPHRPRLHILVTIVFLWAKFLSQFCRRLVGGIGPYPIHQV